MTGNRWSEVVFRGEGYALPTNAIYYIEGCNPSLDAFVRRENIALNGRLEASGRHLVIIGLTEKVWAQYLSLRPDVDKQELVRQPLSGVHSALCGHILYRTPKEPEDDAYAFMQADVSHATPEELEDLLAPFMPVMLYAECCYDMPGRAALGAMPCEEAMPCEKARARRKEVARSVQQQFISELEEALGKLSEEGMNIFLQTLGNDFLKSLSNLAPKPLSPIKVDQQFRIVLEDYDLEIKMNALWKAIYILFLRHPEGIILKDMPDYREELSAIYYAMGCGEYERMEATLDDVTTPGSDNFRQYVSKINRAFTSVLAVDLAQHYMITGQRGKAYRIQLDEHLRNVSVF